MVRNGTFAFAIAGLSLFTIPVAAGPAINQFELKDLESAPGDFEFQSQNAWSTGQPSRKSFGAGDETVFDDNTVIKQREALEVQLGVTDWFRLRFGVEYEQERLDDPSVFSHANDFGSLKFDEVAIEGLLVFVQPKTEGIGLGLLVEYGSPVDNKEEASELYVGPIIEAHTGPWTAMANLMFVKSMGGSSQEEDFVRDEKWDFAYFTQLAYETSENWAFALEAYGTFDRIGDTGTPGPERALFGDHDQHRAGPIVYYTFVPCPAPLAERAQAAALDGDDNDEAKEWTVSIGTGVLFGLNENTPDATYKLSLEVEY